MNKATKVSESLKAEYACDYSKAKPNRFDKDRCAEPEDFERLQRKPRTLGFAEDLIGDCTLDEFKAVTPEDMGFEEYLS
jgi:hypothetical protein